MIYCGIDASTSCTGWSIFDGNSLIAHGAIRPKESAEWRDRVMQECMELSRIFKEYRPQILYAEDVPNKPGQLTMQKLGVMQGVLLSLCAAYHIKPYFLLPANWRRDMELFDGTRDGMHRDILKEKAILMANDIFGLSLLWNGAKSKKTEDDEAEAILIAYSQIRKITQKECDG